MPLRGLNSGGWLVIERWMTPSLFEDTVAKNEYKLSKLRVGKARIASHHKNLIAELYWSYKTESPGRWNY